MLKAVVGTLDSSGIVKARIQSGPTIPDSFCFPVIPQASQPSASQNHQNGLATMLDQKYNVKPVLDMSCKKVPHIPDDKYVEFCQRLAGLSAYKFKPYPVHIKRHKKQKKKI